MRAVQARSILTRGVRSIDFRLAHRFPRQYEAAVTAAFHRMYYGQLDRTWRNTRWLGVRIEKFPGDMVVYQEILHALRPDLIIETGTNYGGSALFMASICDLIGHGQIVTIDIDPKPDRPTHPRISFLTGSSTAADVLDQVHALVANTERRLVILDSDHSYEHVVDELRCYSDFVTNGSYLIVEDTHHSGHPVGASSDVGPWEAASRFLERDDRFVVDETREKFFMTTNPRGYLRRI